MASDTVPAAAPGPHDPANPTTAPASPLTGLAGVLAPVQPARTAAFTLDPATDGPAGVDEIEATQTTAASGSSDAYHTPDNDARNGNGSGNGKAPKEGVVKAWLRAGAERWRKGADIRIKRLDMLKAKAQAAQVKETRQVVMNRSAGLLSGGNSSSGMGGGKGVGKNSGGGSGRGPKNSSGSTGRGGSSGRSGNGAGSSSSGGRGPGAGSGGSGSRGASGGGKGSDGRAKSGTGGTDFTKKPKTDASQKTNGRSTKTNSGSNDKDGKQGATGSTGKDGKAPHGKASDGKTTGKSGTGTTSTTTTCGPGSGIDTGKDKTPKTTKADKTTTGKDNKTDPATKGGTVDLAKKPDAKTDASKTGKDTKDANAKGKKDPAAGPNQPGKRTTSSTGKTPAPAPAGGTPIRTQAAREAGYRDGSRAGRVVAQVLAYRDGLGDGYDDALTAADHDKQRLDAARQQRQQQRNEDQPMPPTVNTVEVTGIEGQIISLGAGASRPTLRRGEVRNLLTFLDRLEQKVTVMQKAAEATKALEAQAQEQATEATQLLEQARQVKGGDRLVGALARLADNAQAQAGQAAEIHKRALRTAEAVQTVLANATTRYKPIFQAVVDSPETRPAEMKFYADRGYQPTTAAA